MNTCGLLKVVFFGLMLASLGTLGAQQQTKADPKAITLPASKLDEYVGQYRVTTEPDVVNAIYREGEIHPAA